MKAKKLLALALTLVMSTSLLAGCGSSQSSSASTASASSGSTTSEAIVPIKFYMMNSPVNDVDRIMEKANAIIEKEIGANLELVMIDGSTYAQKMNLMINGGDAWDLCFTANWGGINFFEKAAKGA